MPISLLSVAFAGGNPLAPLVIGEEGSGNDEGDDEEEEEFHGVISIAQEGAGEVGGETKMLA